MANFSTHLAVGAVASGLGATIVLAADVVPPQDLATLIAAGAAGSILPDIDLEKTTPSRLFFSILGMFFAFVALFHFYKKYSLVELWIIWVAVYGAVRLGLWRIFHKRTIHRGIFHSLLAGGFFAVLGADILANALGRAPVVAWFAGLFVFGGYIVHLLLDELYSVDFEGVHLKRSFGTALKLFQYDSPRASLLMAGALFLALTVAPPGHSFIAVMNPQQVGNFFAQRFLPKGRWFASDIARATPAQESGEVSGSMPAAPVNSGG